MCIWPCMIPPKFRLNCNHSHFERFDVYICNGPALCDRGSHSTGAATCKLRSSMPILDYWHSISMLLTLLALPPTTSLFILWQNFQALSSVEHSTSPNTGRSSLETRLRTSKDCTTDMETLSASLPIHFPTRALRHGRVQSYPYFNGCGHDWLPV